jgi:hypothetical protein
MERLFPTHLHTKVGTALDSGNVGKTVQEKNEQLKGKWAGYKHEEKHLREHIETETAKRKAQG